MENIKESVVRGMAWTVAMRWVMRGMGLVSIAILARLLAPEDFGLLTMAIAVTALSEILLDFGVDTAIIRDQDATRRHFDTAWTVRILQSLGAAALVVMLAWPAAAFYRDERVTGLLLIAALGIAVRGFENIGTVLWRRDLDFRKDFIFNVITRLMGIFATIAFALILRNYWALILGPLVRNVGAVGASFVLSSYRPRLTLKEWNEIWSFSKWNLVKGIAVYSFQWLDRVAVGRFIGAHATGLYNVSSELSTMATGEIIGPLNRVLVPGLSKLNKDIERLQKAFLKAQNAVVTVALPASLGISLTATEVVPLLLGDGWLETIPIIQVFWLFAASQAMVSMSGNLLTISGHIRLAALLVWGQALLFVVLIYPAYLWQGVVGLALAKGATGCATFLFCAELNRRVNGITFWALFIALWRPVVAAGLMALAVYAVPSGLADMIWAQLLIKVAVGAGVYCFVVLLLWALTGRPDGFETIVLSQIARLVKRLIG